MSSGQFVALADVEERSVEWLVDGMIPTSALTLLVGEGGKGKTTLAIHVGARITKGEPVFPGMSCASPADVLVVSAEDSIAHVMRPRARIAGADLTRIHAFELASGDLSFPTDVPWLRDEARDRGAKLVVIDPLSAFVEGRIDTHNDASVRRTLRPLHGMAEELGIAVLVVVHTNKGQGGNVTNRVNGSVGFVNAARSALVFAPDPREPNNSPRRVVAVGKSNYAATDTSFDVVLAVPAGESHPRIEYVGRSSLDAGDLLTGPKEGGGSVRDGVVEWLRAYLADGSRRAKDLEADAAAVGHSWATVRRAADTLGVVKRREGNGEGAASFWSLALVPAQHEQADQVSNLSKLDDNGEGATVPWVSAA
jgi:KaiC/GvpD/RAD55 family RecA-like ATPase